MKMKEEAENKCAPLLAEIAEDKRRRADLQRKLKEASVEMRTEKKAAQQQASKLLKDSQQLKIKLTKMENVAQKQAAVLKRKIDQASAKEKAKVELVSAVWQRICDWLLLRTLLHKSMRPGRLSFFRGLTMSSNTLS